MTHPLFSICTLVTRPAQYNDMLHSFAAAGFGDCEFLTIDNSNGNTLDGYQGANYFLAHASGKHIIICHQDIVLDFDNRIDLEQRLAELTRLDPTWAVCGNAGLTSQGQNVIRISDPHSDDTRIGPFPSRVVGLDENFVVVRRTAELSVSPHLTGFHLYATDLCCSAFAVGRSAYVIDFHLRHLSGGSAEGFDSALHNLAQSMVNQPGPRLVGNTCGATFVGGPSWARRVGNRLLRSRLRPLAYHLPLWPTPTPTYQRLTTSRL